VTLNWNVVRLRVKGTNFEIDSSVSFESLTIDQVKLQIVRTNGREEFVYHFI
jgi:hypothetical protein